MGRLWIPKVTAEDHVAGNGLSRGCRVLSLLSKATVVTLPLLRLWISVATSEDHVAGNRLSCRCRVLSLLSWTTVVTLPLLRLGKSASLPERAKSDSKELHSSRECRMYGRDN